MQISKCKVSNKGQIKLSPKIKEIQYKTLQALVRRKKTWLYDSLPN